MEFICLLPAFCLGALAIFQYNNAKRWEEKFERAMAGWEKANASYYAFIGQVQGLHTADGEVNG